MTWLHIPSMPSNSALESACSERESLPHSDYTDSTTEPLLTLSGKLLLPRNLSRSWKRNAFLRRLSGLTCSRSMADRFAAEWIASLPDSHASLTALQASEPVLKMSDGSGLTSFASCARMPMQISLRRRAESAIVAKAMNLERLAQDWKDDPALEQLTFDSVQELADHLVKAHRYLTNQVQGGPFAYLYRKQIERNRELQRELERVGRSNS